MERVLKRPLMSYSMTTGARRPMLLGSGSPKKVRPKPMAPRLRLILAGMRSKSGSSASALSSGNSAMDGKCWSAEAFRTVGLPRK